MTNFLLQNSAKWCTIDSAHHRAPISARGEAGYRSGFRFQRPGVRIPPGGPKKRVSPSVTLSFFIRTDIRAPRNACVSQVLRAETTTSSNSTQNRGSNPFVDCTSFSSARVSRNTVSLWFKTKTRRVLTLLHTQILGLAPALVLVILHVGPLTLLLDDGDAGIIR